MADSVDRVFVHALNTVKKIPRTGSARPPPGDRLRLYGLYKQAMEGDVDGVMDRPTGDYFKNDDLIKEQEKWDAWDAQKGVSRTEAKRRYIEALIETMHRYASHTADARELVAELEFVWDQIKNNSPQSTSSGSSPPRTVPVPRQFARPQSGKDGPMRVLSPMSQDDESEARDIEDDREDRIPDDKKASRWRSQVEAAMVKMTAEMAALREQIATGREWRTRKRQTISAWFGWLVWIIMRHIFVDAVLLGVVLFWMRRRKDRRLEDAVRSALRILREYARMYLPAR